MTDDKAEVIRYIRTLDPTYRTGYREREMETQLEYGEDRIYIANMAGK